VFGDYWKVGGVGNKERTSRRIKKPVPLEWGGDTDMSGETKGKWGDCGIAAEGLKDRGGGSQPQRERSKETRTCNVRRGGKKRGGGWTVFC